MNFEFATATRIIFGPGRSAEIGRIAASFGPRALLVTGNEGLRAHALRTSLEAASVSFVSLRAIGEPTIATAESGAAMVRGQDVACVIAIGGGSVIDTGKAIAALAGNPGSALEYLEVIGAGKPLSQPPLPFVALPTTAGSGAEVTRNAVLSSSEHGAKASLRSPLMLPRVAIVDSELTHSLPPAVTAATGLDALSQLIEPFVSSRANAFVDALCRDGIRRAAAALPRAFDNGADAAAREDMALASLFGGMALANSGLGAVHGFAAPIGGMFPAPHGAVCAQLLPVVWRANTAALRTREPAHPALARYAEAAQLLTGRANAGADDGARFLADLRERLRIPPLRAYGMAEADVDGVAAKAAVASSMQANPVKLTADELRAILTFAL